MIENRYVMEMLNRQRIEEIQRIAEQDRLLRMAAERPARTANARPLATAQGGRFALDASGAREVPGL